MSVVSPDLADWSERQYLSQYSQTPLTLTIYISGVLGDPDGMTVAGQLLLQNADGTVTPVNSYAAVREAPGTYVITPSSADTAVPANAELNWSYHVSGSPQQYASLLTIGPANPFYDALPLDMKDFLEEQLWSRFRDLFDSPDGGPNLQAYFQSHWSRGRVAQLMAIAVGKINSIAQPWANYTLDGSVGPEFPIQLWGGLLSSYCVTVDTPVLTADLRWVPAGELRPGDKLVGFDEQLEGMGKGQRSRFRTAIVEANEPGFKRCYRIRTTEGEVTATYDHKWVVWDRRGRRRWVETQYLDPERHVLLSIGEPRLQDQFSSGYLSGLYDGEGCLTIRPDRRGSGTGSWLYFAQNEGPVLDRFTALLKERGYDFSIDRRHHGGASHVYLKGGMLATMRMLSETRPERFMARPDLSLLWEGRNTGGTTFRRGHITSVEDVGIQPIAGMQTSTGTFIANGFLAHNTYCEMVKHLIRSYTEQPLLQGGAGITRVDRRDYTDRWRQVLQDEQAELKSLLDVFKIRHMGLGNPKVLVSGGTYGRYAPTRIAGSVAARPRMWARWY